MLLLSFLLSLPKKQRNEVYALIDDFDLTTERVFKHPDLLKEFKEMDESGYIGDYVLEVGVPFFSPYAEVKQLSLFD